MLVWPATNDALPGRATASPGEIGPSSLSSSSSMACFLGPSTNDLSRLARGSKPLEAFRQQPRFAHPLPSADRPFHPPAEAARTLLFFSSPPWVGKRCASDRLPRPSRNALRRTPLRSTSAEGFLSLGKGGADDGFSQPFPTSLLLFSAKLNRFQSRATRSVSETLSPSPHPPPLLGPKHSPHLLTSLVPDARDLSKSVTVRL